MSSNRRKDERRNVLKMLNDHTPLPTVLQEMIVQYLLPTGYTIVYDNSKFKYPGDDNSSKQLKQLFVPYDTNQTSVPSCEWTLSQDETWSIRRYKDGVVVHSEDVGNNVHINLYVQGKSKPILLLDELGSYTNMYWICIFQDKLILQARNTLETDNFKTSYSIVDLHAAYINREHTIESKRTIRQLESGTFVSLNDKCLLYLTADRIRQFTRGLRSPHSVPPANGDDDGGKGCGGGDIFDHPSQVIELKCEVDHRNLKRHFVLNGTDICFEPEFYDTTIWLLSTVRWEWSKITPLPERYKLIPCSIDDRLVAMNIYDTMTALTYCFDTQSWINTNFPLVLLGSLDGII